MLQRFNGDGNSLTNLGRYYLARQRKDLNSIFSNSFLSNDLLGTGTLEKSGIPIDLKVDNENVIVKAEIPGLDSKDIKVEVGSDTLLIETHVEDSVDDNSNGYVIKERSIGSMRRDIKLPYLIDTESSKSVYNNGILEITLPKKEKSGVKQLEVKSSNVS